MTDLKFNNEKDPVKSMTCKMCNTCSQVMFIVEILCQADYQTMCIAFFLDLHASKPLTLSQLTAHTTACDSPDLKMYQLNKAHQGVLKSQRNRAFAQLLLSCQHQYEPWYQCCELNEYLHVLMNLNGSSFFFGEGPDSEASSIDFGNICNVSFLLLLLGLCLASLFSENLQRINSATIQCGLHAKRQFKRLSNFLHDISGCGK